MLQYCLANAMAQAALQSQRKQAMVRLACLQAHRLARACGFPPILQVSIHEVWRQIGQMQVAPSVPMPCELLLSALPLGSLRVR